MAEDLGEGSRSPQPQARRRLLNSRACDRCRRRKAKCDASSPRHRCSPCQEAGEQCTFDRPLVRRGPKTRKRSEGLDLADTSALSSATDIEQDTRLAFTSPTGNPDASGLGFGSAANSPITSWDLTAGNNTRNINIDAALSPQTVRSGGSERVAQARVINALKRWNSLSQALALVNFEVERMVNRCLDLFFQYLYPLTPLVHEPSLRSSLAFFVSQSSSAIGASSQSPGLEVTNAAAVDSWSSLAQTGHSAGRGKSEPWVESSFTLITAVCAEAAFLLPKDLFPEGELVGDIFLRASRNCLNSYLEADLESPNASSVAIRYFHSNCIHAAGKPKYSWHIFGEATRLAQVMQLHEESSLEGLLPIEAELRRRVFWIVYLGDKSAAILNNRPITLHRFSFETGITTAYPLGIDDEAPNGISPGAEAASAAMRSASLITGFNANVRLWQAASDLLLELRLMQDAQRRDMQEGNLSNPPLAGDQKQRLDKLYVQLITCLDDLPTYLQSCTSSDAPSREQTRENQFVIQFANLQVSYQCLRMVIAQKFDAISYFGTSVEQSNLRRTEIARDMLRVMQVAPFWSLQVNGEPYVEKIRLIGASLLAIIHRSPDSPLASRARSDFSILLDILTRLDSKASDALRSDLHGDDNMLMTGANQPLIRTYLD